MGLGEFPYGLIIVEGIYSICDQLYNKYDIKIFVECIG